jgi:hypothetical protein
MRPRGLTLRTVTGVVRLGAVNIRLVAFAGRVTLGALSLFPILATAAAPAATPAAAAAARLAVGSQFLAMFAVTPVLG